MNRTLVFSAFAVNFFLLNLFLSLLFFLGFLFLQNLWRTRKSGSWSDLLFYSIAIPPVLAWVILVASLLPPFLTLEDHLRNPHFQIAHPYHHLCFFHSPMSLPSSLVFRGLLITSLSLILFSLLRVLYAHWKRQIYLGWLMRKSLIPQEAEVLSPQARSLLREFREKEGVRIHLIRSNLPVCFLSGSFRPQIILSVGLLRLLSCRQIRALLWHEIAHHIRLDNLTQLILSFCRDLLHISPPAHLLFRRWRQEAELLCDEIAIHRTHNPLDLAEALLKIQRALAEGRSWGIEARLSSAFFQPLGTAYFERRIGNILSFCDRDLARPKAPSPRLSPFLGLVGFASFSFFLLCLLEIWLDPLLLHCQLERMIRLLV